MSASANEHLTGFLLARIDEDEAAAQAAHENWPGPWTYDRKGGEVHHSGEGPWGYDRPYVCNADGHLADEHIARFDPTRMLADCEARREIVTDFMRWDLLAKHGDMAALGTAAGLRDACLRLAAIHKDHPDFDEAWLP